MQPRKGLFMKEILYIIVLSLSSLVALFLLSKIMGYRQIGQMCMFDYINGITIGSIAAEMATSLENNPLQPLTAMIVYALGVTLLSYLSNKSIRLRRFIVGKPVILLNNGEIYERNLKKAKIDINEFLTQCRVSGYFDISKLQTAVLEPDGRISFLPLSTDRPLTPGDMNMEPTQDTIVANIIIDGHIMEKNLHHTGKNDIWLHQQLKAQGADSVADVLLATVDMQNQLTVYLKNEDVRGKDLLI